MADERLFGKETYKFNYTYNDATSRLFFRGAEQAYVESRILYQVDEEKEAYKRTKLLDYYIAKLVCRSWKLELDNKYQISLLRQDIEHSGEYELKKRCFEFKNDFEEMARISMI